MAHPDLDPRRSPRLAGFEATFREETRQLFLERARFLLKTTLVLYPAFWFLDLAMAPEKADDINSRTSDSESAMSQEPLPMTMFISS